ncbi:hypothetical protein K2173_002393 [Erythroxylum novogranatense]|uniref:Uncharacterized protein n=1 Tax=Erythroxylum novogranatense TaxID=1862640 RepID=A0AAV8T9Y0_9ROSI|nr:hypothetical protein K2173_002393 [Erythroxylum novogranatense]
MKLGKITMLSTWTFEDFKCYFDDIGSPIYRYQSRELVERAKEKEEKEAKKHQCLADEFTKVLQTCKVVDFGEGGHVRCSRWKGFTDETPRDYHCNLGPDGRRSNADERPELCRGTVEFVATKEYMVREPMESVYFVLIDVSMNAIQTGAIYCDHSSINQVIGDLPPLMLIVPDVKDVYTPLQNDVIVPLLRLPSIGIGALSAREAGGRSLVSTGEKLL